MGDYRGKRGRGSENKVAFVASVEMRNGHPYRLHFDPVQGFSFEAFKPWAARALALRHSDFEQSDRF